MTNDEIILLGKLSGQVESVLQRQDEQNRNIGKLFDGMDSVNTALSRLPCTTHEGKIKLLDEWKASCNGADKEIKVEKLKGTISLKNGLILILVTAVTTGIVTKLIEVLVSH